MPRIAALMVVLLSAIHVDAQITGELGAKVYSEHCASCHDSGVARIPSRAGLQQRTAPAVRRALESGLMQQQGAALEARELIAVAEWLGRKTALGTSPSSLMNPCKICAEHDFNQALPSWTSWGGNLNNLRFQPAKAAGLSPSDARRLRLKWAFAIPDATAVRSQPAVYAGRVLLGGEGALYSLDAATGCMHWAVETPTAVRSGIAVGSPGDAPLAFFGDGAGYVYAINVLTGSPVWQRRVDAHPMATVTGTPVYYEQRLYVPVASLAVCGKSN